MAEAVKMTEGRVILSESDGLWKWRAYAPRRDIPCVESATVFDSAGAAHLHAIQFAPTGWTITGHGVSKPLSDCEFNSPSGKVVFYGVANQWTWRAVDDGGRPVCVCPTSHNYRQGAIAAARKYGPAGFKLEL